MDNETLILSLDKMIEKMECRLLHDYSYIENEKLHITFWNDEFDVDGASLPMNIEGWKLADIKIETKVHYDTWRDSYSTHCVITLIFDRV